MKEKRISESLLSHDEEAAGWLVTYADLFTLLLVFFILLYSLSTIKKKEFYAALVSIKHTMESNAFLAEHMDMFDFPDYGSEKISLEEVSGLRPSEDFIIKDVNKFITQNNDSNDIQVFAHVGKVIIRIDGNEIFHPGSAKLNKGFLIVLDRVLEIIFNYPDYTLNIKGHTDDMPINTEQFPSNWELSAVRATAVLKYLVKHGVDPKRLTATGYGSTIPIVANDSEKNRAKNRRVEFVLEKETHQY